MDNDNSMDVENNEPEFYRTLHVTPLVEIFNISVEGNVPDEFGVHGSIEVTDRGHTFFIFDLPKDRPQLMVSGGNLLLTVGDDLDDAVIIPSEDARLTVKLSAIYGNDTVTLHGDIPLDRTTDLDDGSVEYTTVDVKDKDNNWTAKVQYAIFPYAVAATVRVMHFSKDDDFDLSHDLDDPDESAYYYETADEQDIADYKEHSCSDITSLFGSVSAFAAICDYNNGQKSTLFSKGPGDYVQIKSGHHINLSRSVVAVPAYSSLKIEVKLFDASNPAKLLTQGDTPFVIEFKPVHSRYTYKKDILMSHGRIRVQVSWSDTYIQLYRDDLSCMSDLDSMDGDSLEKGEVMSEQQVGSKRPYSATLNDECSSPEDDSPESTNWVLPPSTTKTYLKLEFFSAVLSSKDNKPLNYYGSIDYFNLTGQPNVFKLGESCPLVCPTSRIPVILNLAEHPMRSLEAHFALLVDIKDASSKAAISRGHIASSWLVRRSFLYDRRICSLIRGELGFSVVHYSIFREAVHARVCIKPSDKCPPSIIIKGKIYARYSNFEPGRCYKSLLFCDEDKGVKLKDSTATLPLLKRLTLPIKSLLIIEADLRVSTVDGRLGEGKVLTKEITFLKNGDYPKQIGDGDLCLDVSVEFYSIFG